MTSPGFSELLHVLSFDHHSSFELGIFDREGAWGN